MLLFTQKGHFLSILLLSITATMVFCRTDRGRVIKKHYGNNLVSLKEMTVGPYVPDYLKGQKKDSGYTTLPQKASESQCALALERIALQPKSCAESYLLSVGRNIYLPVYQWFTNATLAAAQFTSDNGVAVVVRNVLMFNQVQVETLGIPQEYTVGDEASFPPLFQVYRTWALNYPTFVRDTFLHQGILVQNIWSFDGRMLTISISRDIDALPVIC